MSASGRRGALKLRRRSKTSAARAYTFMSERKMNWSGAVKEEEEDALNARKREKAGPEKGRCEPRPSQQGDFNFRHLVSAKLRLDRQLTQREESRLAKLRGS